MGGNGWKQQTRELVKQVYISLTSHTKSFIAQATDESESQINRKKTTKNKTIKLTETYFSNGSIFNACLVLHVLLFSVSN
jgi:hypothetical protein